VCLPTKISIVISRQSRCLGGLWPVQTELQGPKLKYETLQINGVFENLGCQAPLHICKTRYGRLSGDGSVSSNFVICVTYKSLGNKQPGMELNFHHWWHVHHLYHLAHAFRTWLTPRKLLKLFILKYWANVTCLLMSTIWVMDFKIFFNSLPYFQNGRNEHNFFGTSQISTRRV